jgi:hypothetical protein
LARWIQEVIIINKRIFVVLLEVVVVDSQIKQVEFCFFMIPMIVSTTNFAGPLGHLNVFTTLGTPGLLEKLSSASSSDLYQLEFVQCHGGSSNPRVKELAFIFFGTVVFFVKCVLWFNSSAPLAC